MGGRCFRHKDNVSDTSSQQGEDEVSIEENTQPESNRSISNEILINTKVKYKKKKLKRGKNLVSCYSKRRSKKRTRSLKNIEFPETCSRSEKEDFRNLESLKTKTLQIFAEMNTKTKPDTVIPHVKTRETAENTQNLRGKKDVPEASSSYRSRRKMQPARSSSLKAHYRRVSYVKKNVKAAVHGSGPADNFIPQVQQVDFFDFLDAEIDEEVRKSVKFVKDLVPACEFILSKIQAMARNLFSGNIKLS